MPLSDEDWDLVTIWVREYLLNAVDPYAQLRLYGFPDEFIATLPLTNVSATNARVLVRASREDIQRQLKLVEAVISIDALAVLPDVEKGKEFLRTLRSDRQMRADIRAEVKDNFRTSVFGDEVFIDRTELRETLREFVASPDKFVLLVDGEPGSGRSYTYTFLRHLGQQSGFRPVRITLSRDITPDRLIGRLADIVDAPAAHLALNPTGPNDPPSSIDDAVHRVVSRATALDERLWLVLDECDKFEPGSEVCDTIGKIALAIYDQACGDEAPRLVLLGCGPGTNPLGPELKASQCRDTARIVGERDLHDFFDQYFRESPPARLGEGEGSDDSIAAMVDLTVEEVLRAATKSGNGGGCYMRRVCTAAEEAVSVYRSSGERNVFAARLSQELCAAEDRSATVSDARRAYRAAACLLSRFDPRLLRLPGETGATGAAALELLDDCTTTGMKDTVVWSLRPEIRDAALRALPGPDAARSALEANRDQFCADSGPERLCLAYLSGHPPPHQNHTPDELADTLHAVRRLSLVPGVHGLPDADELQLALDRARLRQPLERLVRGPFESRTAELAAIRSYVRDAQPPPVPPLVIHGPGGMGKSTLLAAFLLHSIDHDRPGFPFAYIDFERPTLSLQEPVTLIAEAARQLGIQYPAHRPEFQALAEECRQAAGSQREEQDRVTQLYGLATTRSVLGRSSSHEFQTLATGRESGLIARVADVLRRAVAGSDQEEQPFVLVIDSFEEAQYRGSPMVGRMWATCRAFQSVYPRMRWVVAGRAPVDHPARDVAPREIELHELEPAAAVALLEDCGVTDPDVATVLAERVGGHPLSLKLAARAVALARSDGADLTGELLQRLPARRERDFRRVDQLLVQGVLYDRILSHIADEDVRRLARPGLALRTITPEIIKDVLAEPCGLPVPTLEAARGLFDELCRLDMVEPAGPDAVRYRADVRAIMLRLPDGDHTAVLHEVERRAVGYYAARDGPADRAEEIYHRLRLDEDPRSVEERWLPGVERFLLGAQQDLPPRAAALLTARLGTGASDKVTEAAEQADWERITAREVADLLAQGFAQEAHDRIRRRRPWAPCSPLHPLFAETLCLLGRRDEARQAVADALAGTRDADCAARRLELLLLAARLAENAGDLASADRDLREAEDTAVALGQDLEAMGALLARARLAAAAEQQDTEAGGQLAVKLREMPDAVLADQPVLVRAVASQIYDRDPGALDHALKVAGLPADDATLETLGGAMRRATTRRPALLGPVMDILNDAIGTYRRPGEEQHGIADLLRLARDRGTLGQLARRLLTVADTSGEIDAGVAAAMGVGTGGRPTGLPAPPAGAGSPRERSPRPSERSAR